MNEDTYTRLGARLNENMVKLPLIDPVLNFLKAIYTEKQAALGADFPIGAHTADALAKTLGRDKDKLVDLLETMADQGLIFTAVNDAQQTEYSLTPFAPGVIEFQSMRGTETPENIARAKLLADMMNSLEELGSELFKNPELANKILPKGLRTITVEKQLPSDTTVRSYEQVSAIVAREKSIAVGHCHCRHTKKLTGDPCTIAGIPEQTCFYFDKVADFMVGRGFARRVKQEEAMDILSACEQAGLVHNLADYNGKNHVLCNCCGCCCDFLVKMNKFPGYVSIFPSNFTVAIDAGTCIACGECVERCAVGALSLDDDVAKVNHDICLGCGNCVSACPTDSLSMTRQTDKPPLKLDIDLVGLGI